MASGVEVGRGFDHHFGGEGFGAVVACEEGLDLADEFFGAVGGNFVAVDFQLEVLPEELRGALGSDSLDHWCLVGQCGAAACESDEHLRVACACFDGAGDFVFAMEMLEVKPLRHGAEFLLLALQAEFEGFKFPALGDDLAGDRGDLSCGIGKRGVFGGGFFSLGGDAAEVDFTDPRCRSGRGCGRSRLGFCCCWHGFGFLGWG